ncbi:hypothetical protein RHGRI_018100 [Rhododendron griersonianum]|uniref:Uncharacterized protein n=1 Tax=Rhododendron griersonianum TaxID=479676 RepID=A0AAV6K089_9ERIC|nr:hypothetical protein RHGRI_018100 [Rhododendron griersonianum]
MDLKFMLMLLLLAACVVNSTNAAGNLALLSAPDPVAVFAAPDHDDLAGYHATAEKAFLAGPRLPPIDEERVTSPPPIDRHFITTSPPDDVDSTKKKALCAGPILPPTQEVTSPPPNHRHIFTTPYPPDNVDSTKH